jgi:hypothetical protein
MSNESTIEISVVGTEWWYYVALMRLEWSRDETDGQHSEFTGYMPTQNSFRLIHDLGTVDIMTTVDKTIIVVTTTHANMARWKPLIAKVRILAAEAYQMRRLATGSQFEFILDEYYAAQERGESPNLEEMARTRGVKIGSLRQAKIRYDAKRREQEH